MDPEANLKEQLEISMKILEIDEALYRLSRCDSERAAMESVELEGKRSEHASRLAELVLALSNWLARGGSHPTWKEV